MSAYLSLLPPLPPVPDLSGLSGPLAAVGYLYAGAVVGYLLLRAVRPILPRRRRTRGAAALLPFLPVAVPAPTVRIGRPR